MGLKDYRSKRNFNKTPEPVAAPRALQDSLVFVVHKHAARALHYDLRLELGGVLKSWAIPKGPSLDPSVRRLAVMVEDHPFEYREFEGIIPEGNYGAGTVIIWDKGICYHPLARDRKESSRLLRDGLKKGDMKFVLEGEKLRGEFALVKMAKGENSWLLLKKKDRFTGSEDILGENRSVVSGRTLEEIAGAVPDKTSDAHIARIRLREATESNELRDTPLRPMPHVVRPMLATAAKEPFDHPDWIFEVKWDGYRAMAEIRNNDVSLYSRNLIPLNKKFGPIAEALQTFRDDAILDGEIVVVDDQGRPDFGMLQDYRKTGRGHLVYYVFDLLYFHGHDLTDLPLLRRKKLLKQVLPNAPELKFSDHVTGEGMLFFDAARQKGLEGIMAKDAGSFYRPGMRSRQWMKIKTRLTQEGVIAGFTGPGGSRKYFGSLVLGVFEGNELICIGHSGGGFSTKALKDIREKLEPLIQAKCPFRVIPETTSPVSWVKPQLVCEVAFQGWTKEGLMRQPTFLRLRQDKDAHDVVKEKTQPPP
ncbi:MAG: hypothetical protein HZA15_05345 [Nitrospirae bacterium]|nr:hypothetical protein [Nitrospirota bacterium]